MQRLILICFFSVCFLHLLSGQTLYGRVIDKETHEPVLFATVYLANTTIGTTSNHEGIFTLNTENEENYDLVVSHTSYELSITPFDSLDFVKGMAVVLMNEAVYSLNGLEFVADTSNRKQYLSKFTDYFIGEVPNSKECNLKNPEDLFVYYDQETNSLYAHASESLEIENEALGYTLYYDLKDFQVDFTSKSYYAFGIPRYQMNDKASKKVKKRRAKAYNGSFTHFTHILHDTLKFFEEFEVREVIKLPNPDKIGPAFFKLKMDELQQKYAGTSPYRDSVSYYTKRHQLSDSIHGLSEILGYEGFVFPGDQLLILLPGIYQVTHKQSREDPNYPPAINQIKHSPVSILHIYEPVEVYPNGYITKPRVIFMEGYWGWSEKAANYLPLGYKP